MVARGENGEDIRPVRSVLDSDLYKFTMQQAILESTLENPPVSYRFTNRSKQMKFTRHCVEQIQIGIDGLQDLRLTDGERAWLQRRCPFFKPAYLDYLAAFQFKPAEQVKLEFVPDADNGEVGDIEMEVKGIWAEVILYEVPLMSIVSETYFRIVDARWTMRGQRSKSRSWFD